MVAAGKRESGFTLIEILVAFVILALSLTALLQAFSIGLQSTRKSAKTLEAIQLARSKLAGVGIEQPLSDGVSGGDFGNGFRWRLDVRPLSGEPLEQIGKSPSKLFNVTVTVRWGQDNSTGEVSLTSLRLDPASGRRK